MCNWYHSTHKIAYIPCAVRRFNAYEETRPHRRCNDADTRNYISGSRSTRGIIEFHTLCTYNRRRIVLSNQSDRHSCNRGVAITKTLRAKGEIRGNEAGNDDYGKAVAVMKGDDAEEREKMEGKRGKGLKSRDTCGSGLGVVRR